MSQRDIEVLQDTPEHRERYKNAALRERIGQITSEYEDRVADLRVRVTYLSNAVEVIQAQNEELNQLVAKLQEPETEDYDPKRDVRQN